MRCGLVFLRDEKPDSEKNVRRDLSKKLLKVLPEKNF